MLRKLKCAVLCRLKLAAPLCYLRLTVEKNLNCLVSNASQSKVTPFFAFMFFMIMQTI